MMRLLVARDAELAFSPTDIGIWEVRAARKCSPCLVCASTIVHRLLTSCVSTMVLGSQVDNTRKPGTKPPSEGFSNWGQWFGSGK